METERSPLGEITHHIPDEPGQVDTQRHRTEQDALRTECRITPGRVIGLEPLAGERHAARRSPHEKVEGETAGRLHHDNKQQAAHRKGRERPIQQRFGRRIPLRKTEEKQRSADSRRPRRQKRGETAIFPSGQYRNNSSSSTESLNHIRLPAGNERNRPLRPGYPGTPPTDGIRTAI